MRDPAHAAGPPVPPLGPVAHTPVSDNTISANQMRPTGHGSSARCHSGTLLGQPTPPTHLADIGCNTRDPAIRKAQCRQRRPPARTFNSRGNRQGGRGTVGCPSAERNRLTTPTGGASLSFAPVGVESPFAQLCHSSRADLLKRRRKVRDEFLGREGKPSQPRPGRAGGRPSLDVWCNPPVGLTPGLRKIRWQPFAERPAATQDEKTRHPGKPDQI